MIFREHNVGFQRWKEALILGPDVLVAQGKIKFWGPNINIKINYEIGLTS
jgi:hypothetical protein